MILKLRNNSDYEVFSGVSWYRVIHNNGSPGITVVEFKCMGEKEKIEKTGFEFAYVMDDYGKTIDKIKV